MKAFFRWSATLTLCVFALSACKPSGAPSATASAGKAASASAPTVQASFSGQYDTLSVPQTTTSGNKVEVLEFFAYFCSYCKLFDPSLTAWAQKNRGKVVFKRVPVAFRDSMFAQQRMYYALEAMGKLDSLHPRIFKAIQEERQSLDTESEIVTYLAKQGVGTTRFKALYNSSAIQDKANQATALQSAYQINSIPQIAIGGRYLTSGTHALKRPGIEMTEAGVQNAVLSIMDELVAKAASEGGLKK